MLRSNPFAVLRLRPLAAAMLFASCAAVGGARAQEQPDEPQGKSSENVTTLDLVTVVGVTPVAGTDIEAAKLPYNVQSADDDALNRSQTLDLSEFMNRNLAGVTVNGRANRPRRIGCPSGTSPTRRHCRRFRSSRRCGRTNRRRIPRACRDR